MVERKCLTCGAWNNDELYCKSCGEPIHPKEIDRLEEQRKQEALANAPKGKFDRTVEKMKTHENVFVRIIYKIGYSISVVFGAIGAFFAWMVAMANG